MEFYVIVYKQDSSKMVDPVYIQAALHTFSNPLMISAALHRQKFTKMIPTFTFKESGVRIYTAFYQGVC